VLIHKTDFLTKLRTRTITAIFLVGLFLVLVQVDPIYFSLLLLLAALYAVAVEMPQFFSPTTHSFWMVVPLYPLLPFALLMILNQWYRPLFIIGCILVSCFDAGSYVVGITMGKTLLAPRMSPRKTWEGFAGGCIATFSALSLICYTIAVQQPLLYLVLLTLSVSGIALCGDLYESSLKRKARIKDSGTLLPGHGGILDRFDSILACAYFLYFCRHALLSFFHL
jgi:phosphatidate cytidylyltransferase